MRTKLRVLGLGVLLLALSVAGCAPGDGEAGYDAGSLPDAALPGDVDAAASPDAGAGQSALDAGTDATQAGVDSGADASDSSPEPVDAASDAGSDATQVFDATDDTSEAATDAPPADATDSGPDTSIDGGTEDAPLDAPGDASQPFDASAVCAGFSPGTNPIQGVSATVAGQTIADMGTAPAHQPVTIQAWTAPAGVMQDISVVYTTDAFTTQTSVSLALAPGTADAGSGQEAWAGQVPGEASGTQVVWYVVAHDICSSAPEYYSNFGANFHYTAE